MSRNYCPTQGEYTLPRTAYMRTIYLIKDLPRMQEEAEKIILGTPDPTETPEIQRQRNIRATETQNIKYAEVMKQMRDTIAIIEEALLEAVAPEDRDVILQSVISNKAFPQEKSRSYYSLQKKRFIRAVAERANII